MARGTAPPPRCRRPGGWQGTGAAGHSGRDSAVATKLQSAGAAAHATRGTSLSGATASVVVRVRHDGYLSVLARVRVCTSMSADAGQHWQPECRGSAAALLQQCCPSGPGGVFGPWAQDDSVAKKIKTIENKIYVFNRSRTKEHSIIVLLPCPFNQY